MLKLPAGMITIIGQLAQSRNVFSVFTFLALLEVPATVFCAVAGAIHPIKHEVVRIRLIWVFNFDGLITLSIRLQGGSCTALYLPKTFQAQHEICLFEG